jgi:hypothetical protein
MGQANDKYAHIYFIKMFEIKLIPKVYKKDK